MSDFFSILVARSYGDAPVIRPRVKSLFEPVRRGTAGLEETLTSRNEESVEEREEQIVAGEPDGRKAEPRTRALPESEEQAATRSADPVVTSLRLEHSGEPERNTITEKLIKKQETGILLGEPRHIDAAPKSIPSAAIIQERNELPRKRMREAMTLPAQVHPAEKERPGQLTPPRITPEMRIPDLVLNSKPQRQRKEESLPRKESQTAEPTVQVTIGRIEVRANRENPHSVRATARPPVMSLDEYLRKQAQRAGQ